MRLVQRVLAPTDPDFNHEHRHGRRDAAANQQGQEVQFRCALGGGQREDSAPDEHKGYAIHDDLRKTFQCLVSLNGHGLKPDRGTRQRVLLNHLK